jgi:hypothetical protein
MLFKPAYIAGLSGFEKFPANFPAGREITLCDVLKEGCARIV